MRLIFLKKKLKIFLLFLHSFIKQQFDVDGFKSGLEHTCSSWRTWDITLLTSSGIILTWRGPASLVYWHLLECPTHPCLVAYAVFLHDFIWTLCSPETSICLLISWLSIHRISQLITTPLWRAQVSGMGRPWMKVAITTGLLRSRTEISTSPSEILLADSILDAVIKNSKTSPKP